MKLLIFLSVLALSQCNPIPQGETVFRIFLGSFVHCLKDDFGLCLKEQALKSTERLRSVRQIQLYEGITLLNNGPKESRSLELSTEPEVRKRQVNEKLWESATDLMKNSELELSYDPIGSEIEESRALDVEGRGKKKKQIKEKLKILIPLLLIAKVKAVILVVASIVVIAISLAKLALLAKLAFIGKVIAILKYLKHKKEEEHGWIAHEEHPHHGWEGGWEGGWQRSGINGNNLAYSAYAPQ